MKKKVFFGWYVVALALISLLMSYGIRYSFGVFFPPMLKEFRWSKTLLSGALTASMFVNAILAPVFGALFDKFGPRWLMTGGAILVGGSMITIGAWVQEPWQLYLIYGVILAVGINGMGVVVNTSMVANWFIKKRGMAVAVLAVGSSLGVFVLSPISNALITSVGWRQSFIILGVILIVLMIPLVLLFARKQPEEMGLRPDGEDNVPIQAAGVAANAGAQEVSLTVAEGLRSRSFWFLFIADTLFGISWFLISTHQVSYAIGIGATPATAAAVFSLVGGIAILGKLLFGAISDKVKDRKRILVVGGLIYTVGYIILLLAKDVATLYAYAIILGLGYGGMGIMGAVAGDHFGRKSMGKLWGFINTGAAIGASIGPILGGYIYDTTKSYALAWEVGIAMAAAAVVSFALMGRPAVAIKAERQKISMGA